MFGNRSTNCAVSLTVRPFGVGLMGAGGRVWQGSQRALLCLFHMLELAVTSVSKEHNPRSATASSVSQHFGVGWREARPRMFLSPNKPCASQTCQGKIGPWLPRMCEIC